MNTETNTQATIDWTLNLHVFTDGTDWIIGETAEAALAAYCEEFRMTIEDTSGPDGFKQLDDDHKITVRDIDGDGSSKTMTARQWIEHQIRKSSDPIRFSRLVCSTEY